MGRGENIPMAGGLWLYPNVVAPPPPLAPPSCPVHVRSVLLQALDKMEDVEDVEDEAKVTIHLPEPGPIGRPIVQVNETQLDGRKLTPTTVIL